ncbi:hypothetical protein TRAPUB_10687 [Trametes pubescens]|uniref:Uncharacterized protein n=1 Tax=Trametes pubescens TaxID=154538 RepID=A0A1M2VYQ2_TRAPU|nr:hypothetical protein TRAPUB_10687 [Trametes pubescens]
MSATSGVPAQSPNIDITVVMQLLGSMRTTYGTLNQSLNNLKEQGTSIKELGPTIQDGHNQIRDLNTEIERHDAQRASVVDTVKNTIKGELREQALAEMRERINAQIRDEVQKQVKVQVDQQLVRDHLQGISLPEQVEGGRVQITALRAAVTNSEARRANAAINDMQTEFKHVVRADGTRSPKWPANVSSLNALSEEDVAELGRDYGLHLHQRKVLNMNGFLSHIGVFGIRLT